MFLSPQLRFWLILVLVPVALWRLSTMPVFPHDGLRIVGLVLATIGMAGVAWAHYTLGASFSVRAKATKLVTTGIYSKIRNPIYVMGGLAVIGMMILYRKPAGWVLIIVMIIVQIIRARNEAKVLEAAFGDEYRRYRTQTWF